jgi:hypothetical protein
MTKKLYLLVLEKVRMELPDALEEAVNVECNIVPHTAVYQQEETELASTSSMLCSAAERLEAKSAARYRHTHIHRH